MFLNAMVGLLLIIHYIASFYTKFTAPGWRAERNMGREGSSDFPSCIAAGYLGEIRMKILPCRSWAGVVHTVDVVFLLASPVFLVGAVVFFVIAGPIGALYYGIQDRWSDFKRKRRTCEVAS